MSQKIPSPHSPRPTPPSKAQSRARARARRRRQIVVGSVFALVLVAGLLSWQRLQRPPEAPSPGLFRGTVRAHGNDAELNGGVLANAVKVQSVLEEYRRQTGRVPASAEAFNQEVLPRLEGGKLPRSPWGGQQEAILGVTPELRQAVAAGEEDRWVVGPGRDARTITAPTDFGALVYDASGTRYRLFGIGRGADGRAVVLVRLTSP